MQLNGIFKHTGSGFQLLLLLALLLLGALLGALAGFLLSNWIYGLGIHELGAAIQASDPHAQGLGRLIQVSGQIGLFVLPPLAWAYLVSPFSATLLGFRNKLPFMGYLPWVLLMLACLPLIHALADLNHQVSFPDSLKNLESWMQLKEKQAEEMTHFFLGVHSLGGLLFNLFMVALIPAFGEELVFRSGLQPLLGKITHSSHAGIIISALLFSAMHLQFYGLFPRFVLGLFLGYAFLWTASIWVPMLMHFVNNAAAVIVFYLAHNGHITTKMDEFGAGGGFTALTLSIILSSFLLYTGYQLGIRNKPD